MYKIFCDMDGVICDFESRFKSLQQLNPKEFIQKEGNDKFWEVIDEEGVGFWVGIKWMSEGKKLWEAIKNKDTVLLSSPSRSNNSRLGKRLWVKNNIPGTKLHLRYSYQKAGFASPNHILIDDRKDNIKHWISEGGVGILFKSTDQVIEDLSKYVKL
jgi:hypothetical protein